jgi:threonine dehydratase
VVGVEPEDCASLHASFDAGKGVVISAGDTICDGSNVPIITDEMYPLLRQLVDVSVTVSEKAVKKTMKDLMLNHKLIVEGSAALALTAAVQESYDDRGKSVCLITGGTIDTEKIVKILSDPEL